MMPKPTRSPVLGYNHNLKYRGRIFHVQTEDSGPLNPRIFTHLYYGGTILASKKHEYDPAAAEDVVRALMQSQHKSILKDLKSARHDDRITKFFAARGEQLDGAVLGAVDALDLDAAPEAGRATPATPQPTFADTFDDEPTTPDQATLAPMESVDVQLDTPLPVPLAAPAPVQGHIPMSAHAPAPQAPLSETPTDRTGVAATGAPRRRPVHSTPAMGAPVVVQRTVSVGGNASVTGGSASVAGSTSTFAGRQLLRGRKPAPSIPYVVKEGTHPLAETPTPAPVDVSPPAAPAPLAAASMPPARPLTPPPVNATNAPITSALSGRMPPAAAAAAVAAGAPVEKSLDEVILAYLAQGGEGER
jgi:hypothetical protein